MAVALVSVTEVPEYHPLHQIDVYLLARGWVCDAGQGWVPPAGLGEAIGRVWGRGRYRRQDAIRAQVAMDEQLFYAGNNAAGEPLQRPIEEA